MFPQVEQAGVIKDFDLLSKMFMIKFLFDYILVKFMCDVKVIPNEESVIQHILLGFHVKIVKSEGQCKRFVPKRRAWKLQQADVRDKFCESFTCEINHTSGEKVDDICSRLN